jgi:DNA helicase II / ATP-dependent DNA helicase PcrA
MPNTSAKKPPAKTRPKRAKTAAGPTSKTAPSESKEPISEKSGIAIGDLVSHPQFGDGTVTAIEKDKLTINFEDGRVKQIVDYYVKRR